MIEPKAGYIQTLLILSKLNVEREVISLYSTMRNLGRRDARVKKIISICRPDFFSVRHLYTLKNIKKWSLVRQRLLIQTFFNFNWRLERLWKLDKPTLRGRHIPSNSCILPPPPSPKRTLSQYSHSCELLDLFYSPLEHNLLVRGNLSFLLVYYSQFASWRYWSLSENWAFLCPKT